ncbi:MAG: ankyrin repeat domain-containing protein [Pontiellaceae bacterium]|nr:ankyrin repeat domain-containing protein [Pontiellaceae bacterium]
MNYNSDFAENLIAAGADPNLRNNAGETPLHLAAIKGQSEYISILLHAGAKIDARDPDGCTPLLNAAFIGSDYCIEELLAADPDIMARTTNGWSAIGICVDRCLWSAYETLKTAGAWEPSWSPLHSSIWNGDWTSFTNELNAGTDIDIKDVSAILAAEFNATRAYLLFRKMMTQTYGETAMAEYETTSANGWSYRMTVLYADLEQLAQIPIQIDQDKAVFPKMPGLGNEATLMIKVDQVWKIIPSLTMPPEYYPEVATSFKQLAEIFKNATQAIQTGRHTPSDIKRMMTEGRF